MRRDKAGQSERLSKGSEVNKVQCVAGKCPPPVTEEKLLLLLALHCM